MYFSGRDGSLWVDGTRMGRVADWSLSSSVDTLDVTDLGANERSYVPGLKSASGSATLFYYDDSPKALLSKVIRTDAPTEADVVQLSLRWGAKKVDVNAIVDKASISCQVGSVMQASISFTVTGDYAGVVL